MNYGATYPIAIDIEWIEDDKARTDDLTAMDRTELAVKFCDTVKSFGYTPMIYASRDMLIAGMHPDLLEDYEVWLSDDYEPEDGTDYPYAFSMWQYSRKGKVDGITGDVDVNLRSGDADNKTGDSSADGVSDADGLIAPDGTVVDGHMWNQVKIDGLWYNLDTTWDDPIGETELRHTYFNVDDSILGLNHEWDKKEAEQCSSTLQNYYEKNGIFFKTSSSFKDALSEYLAAGNRDEYECAVSYVDTNEEFLSFIFDYEGITSYQVATRGEESAYQILTIYFNPEPE